MTINNLNSTIVSIFSAGNITNDVTLNNVSPVANGQLLVLLNATTHSILVGGNIPSISANTAIAGGSAGMFVYSTNNTPVGWMQIGDFPTPQERKTWWSSAQHFAVRLRSLEGQPRCSRELRRRVTVLCCGICRR